MSGGKTGLSVAVACAAQLVNAINIGACPLMIPDIAHTLGGATTTLSWVVSGYAIAFGGFVLWGGHLTDAIGSRRALMIGFAVFACGAVVAGVAPNTWALVFGRVVQGTGAALAIPGALAWLASSTSDPRVRSRRLAAFAASGAIGFGAGALCGGVLSDVFGWRSVFVVQCVVLTALGFLAGRMTQVRVRRGETPTFLGALLTSTALLLLALWLTVGANFGWASRPSLVVVAVTAGLWLAAVTHERLASAAMIPHRLWRIPGLTVVLIATGFLYASWACSYYFGAMALQHLVGLSMTSAALWLAPLSIGALLGSRVAAAVLSRWNARYQLIVVGGVICALGPAGASYLSRDSSATEYLLVLLVAIFGQVMAFVGQSDLVLTLVGPSSTGIGGALFNSFGQIGGGIGLAAVAIVFGASGGILRTAGLTGYPGAFRAAALLGLISTAMALVLTIRLRAEPWRSRV